MKRSELKRGSIPLGRTRLRAVGKKARKDRTELERLAPFGSCEAGFSLLCTGRAEHRHHLLRRSQGGTNEPSNICNTCAPCHRAIHANPADAYARGLLRHSWDNDAA